MAEEESELELDRFKNELESLLEGGAGDEHGLQSKNYCARFCELVEEHTSLWQVPLPQLEVLRSALCAFVHGAASFPSDCEHVRYTLSSLALSVFELLLFFGKDEFPEHPLKDILDSFQECHSSLVRYQNVYLLQVRQIIKDGGPWASPVLQGILKELDQPQVEVDRYLGSEMSVFFELRVRYLLACERTQEAMALAQRCSQHSTAGRHLFFKQAYLSCLWRASRHEQLLQEMAEIDGKDAVDILCIAEKEEKDELLLDLSRGFLLQQLRNGNMYYLWDLVFIWCKLYLRVKACKQDLLEECKRLMLSATNIKAIFPFMKLILEVHFGKDGLTFCVELCAQALQTDLKNDPCTKSLIYKTIAYLLPSDLEICRACALLVFFLERTVEAYKTVYLLYTHPDQVFHMDTSPVGNHIRFEVIQILKKGLLFDPEFWSLLNIKTNCLKLMSDQVAKAALCEIMEEDKWVPNYCVRGHCKCHAEQDRTVFRPMVKPASINKQESGTVEERSRLSSVDASSKVLLPKRRGRKPGSQIAKDLEPFPVRRSFRQLDLAQNLARQLTDRRQRFLTRQAEKKTLKRRGRKPRWLLEELASQAENSVPRQGRKPGRKPKQLNILKDIVVDVPVIEITMELSYPDNEVDLPADIPSRPVSAATSTTGSSFDDSKCSCPWTPMQPCDESPNSHCQVLSNESPPSWKEKAKAAEEFVFRAQDSITFLRKFHTYSKVPEEEDVLRNDLDDERVMATPHDVEQKTQDTAPVRNDLTETVKVNPADKAVGPSATPAVIRDPLCPREPPVPQEGTFDVNKVSVMETHASLELSSVTPTEDVVGLKNVLSTQNITVNLPRDEATTSVADTVSTPDNAAVTAGDTTSPNNTHNKCTDHICPSEFGLKKATDNASAPENSPQTAPNTTPSPEVAPQRTTDTNSTPEKGPNGLMENASVAPRDMTHASENVSVIASSPGMFTEEKVQEPVVHHSDDDEVPCTRSPVTNSSDSAPSPQNVVRLKHRCGLCNKEYRNASILRHAFWHYRLERKCMFCQSFTYVRGPLCHFKKHIKQLKDFCGLAGEKKCKSLPDLPAKPDQTVQGAVPKKARPGLAQIKSSLLMRLNFRRKTAPHKAENSTDAADTDKRTFKQSITNKSISTQKPDEKDDKEESKPKSTIRYFTRGLVRKSESKGRFLRKRLARKAKTRTLRAERDVLVPKDNPAHTLNGVIRKKRKLKHVQDESNHATDKNAQGTTKQENKEQKTDNVESEEKTGHAKRNKAGTTNAEEKTLNSTEAREQLLQRSGLNKKKSKLAKQKEDVGRVKKRKVDTGTKERKQDESNDAIGKPAEGQEITEAGVSNTNGTMTESNETSQPLRKNKKQMRTAPSVVNCPGETCTFYGRPGPVLSHILIHHPGDTKALEFFYNFAKQKCLFCGRRIWSPQHFFDHIVSHRGNLKHPCYHVDCKERFKTRLELGDHMLKDHHPLRAACCFPGCTVQVSNPKFLYSHERGHYNVVQKKVVHKKDKSVTSKDLPCEKGVEMSPTAASPKTSLETQPKPESMDTSTPQTQSHTGTAVESNAASAKQEDEMSLTLNKSSVNYTHKTPRLVNGHSDHEREAPAKTPALPPKEQDTEFGKMSTKPFVRPPPSAYLDELYISMPKRWKGPQVNTKGSRPSEVIPIKRQVCPRCSASFNSEQELQDHREKCTSLFGFDSDDESAS